MSGGTGACWLFVPVPAVVKGALVVRIEFLPDEFGSVRIQGLCLDV